MTADTSTKFWEGSSNCCTVLIVVAGNKFTWLFSVYSREQNAPGTMLEQTHTLVSAWTNTPQKRQFLSRQKHGSSAVRQRDTKQPRFCNKFLLLKLRGRPYRQEAHAGWA
jgi:hypothetical protein